VSSVVIFVSTGVAGYQAQTGHADKVIYFVAGMAMIFCAILSMISIGLGVAGLREKGSRKVFPALGLSLSIGTFVLFILFVFIGLSIQK